MKSKYFHIIFDRKWVYNHPYTKTYIFDSNTNYMKHTLKRKITSDTEVLYPSALNRDYIVARVEDWKKRIDVLFSEVAYWLEGDTRFTYKDGRPNILYQDLMRTFNVPEEKIRTLDVYYDGKLILVFKPKGLWITSGNGRIDLLTYKGSFMLIDFAEQFQPSQWNLYTPYYKPYNLFDKDTFFQALQYLIK